MDAGAPDAGDAAPVDASTRLNPAVPPIWLGLPAVQVSARGQWRHIDGRVGIISELYRVSQLAEFEDVTSQLPPEPDLADDALHLLWEVTASRAGDEATRARACDQLRLRMAAAPAPWIAAWCRAALGRSMLKSTDEETRLLAIAELSTVPAAYEFACPYLTGVCMAEAAVTMNSMGDTKAAGAIRQRMTERLAGHPALDWEPLRKLNVHPSVPVAASPGGEP
jgi:hypothetical protein